MPDAFALEWSPWRVRLRALPEGTAVERELPSLVPGARHDLALFPGPPLSVRVPGGARAPFLLSPTLEPAPRVPGEGALSTVACRAHDGGTLTAIDGSTVWILPPSPRIWLSRRLPDGVQARDVSLGADGLLYVCGSSSKHAVVARLEPDGHSLLVPILTATDGHRLAQRGADEAFWRVDASAEPLVLTASCAWLLEDDTDFAVLRWGEIWSVRICEREAIRSWHRSPPAGISLYTARGRRHTTGDAGASFTVTDLVAPIQRAADGLRQGTIVLRAAREAGDDLLVAASAYDWKAPEARQLLASAALISRDRGATFAPLAETTGPEHEILDVCFSPA